MSTQNLEAIVIGTSAGAVEALSALLPALPENFPVPVMVVIHLPPDKKSVMADLLQNRCKVRIKEAEDKEPIQPGTVYLAPPDYHLLVEKNKRLSLSSDEPVLYSRPSIDVLFETAADAYGQRVLGVILTGANLDGARGLKTIMELGGGGVVQQPDTAYASAMPEAALRTSPEAKVLTLEEIAKHLVKVAS